MGPEDSTEKVQLYMMVDGQPVEISPEIAEIKLTEDQQSNDILDFGECEITVQLERPPAPLVHGRMLYHCDQCGRSWVMFLEKGIEEFGENHKPSPFTIECPHCGGWAMDVSGIQKIPGGYIPLPDGCNYFANMENKECGVPVFCPERLQESGTQALIADAVERMKNREMEMYREAMREELARTDEIMGRTAADTGNAIRMISVIIAEKTGVSVEGATGALLNAIQEFGVTAKAALASLLEEPDLTALEPVEPLDVSAARERKETRGKQQIVERAATSRFRQYKAKEYAWAAQKRTGPRQREWRGPWREGKN